jgi:hypothetical protein
VVPFCGQKVFKVLQFTGIYVLSVGTMLFVREMCGGGENVQRRLKTVLLMSGWDVPEDQRAMRN